MAYKYYVNRNSQSTGEHEVHKTGCNHAPAVENMKFLGVYNDCRDAVKEAKKYYNNVDGCYWCTNCHTK